jgi:hypothetical protein
MPASLPYLVSPGSLKTALDRIKEAATPPRVNGEFVEGVLLMKGGTGKAIIPYLKKIGLVAPDGTPTDLYKRFRGSEKISKIAAGEAVLLGYKELAQINEKFYDLSESELTSLILQITGHASNSDVARRILSTLLSLKSYASFENGVLPNKQQDQPAPLVEQYNAQNRPPKVSDSAQVDFRLAYTINLNLPATTDQAVFNAIFKSLKEHLLTNDE